mgnify:CR=1 FL=1|jgi:hypothetical protein|tara:strand:+ start:175 stop:627 length:453 start_codon:yes stop_codon:yes gene_type:complete
MYIIDLYKELQVWRKIKKIAKNAEKELNEKGFRVDWVGRIYTVINLPEEVVTAPISQEGYVLMKLREHDKFLLKLGIADYVSPEFSPIEGTDSFLLVLSADREYLRLKPFLISLAKTLGLLLLLRLIYLLFESHSEKISELWSKIITTIF